MADKTKIEWSDATWNPVTGCAKVSQGCKHCYAERDWCRLVHMPAFAGRAFTDVACHPERLDQPLRWKKPRRVFVNSMSDLFHEAVPEDFIDEVFGVMAYAAQHTFQVLTKRPARMAEYLKTDRRFQWADAAVRQFGGVDPDAVHDAVNYGKRELPNVWIGVSIEDQATADERIPLLLQTPAAVRWVSAEPLLGPSDISEYLRGWRDSTASPAGVWLAPKLDWLVLGGESGPKARPMHPQWARDLRDQCAAAGVPFLFKQHGEWAHSPEIIDAGGSMFHRFDDGVWMQRIGKKAAGRLLDGVLHDDFYEECLF